MATVDDLYTALFGFPARVRATHQYQKPAFDAHALVHQTWFTLPLKTSNGDTLDVRVDASKAFYSIFTLADFPYSKTHKNYTLSKGTRGQPRTFIDLPSPGALKRTPEYQKMVEDNKMWADARTKAAKNMVEEGMIAEISEKLPNFATYLNTKDEDIRGYLEGQGWTIAPEVTFENWRPCGWIMTSQPDGYGHECGTHAVVNWEAKTITVAGWSSDD